MEDGTPEPQAPDDAQSTEHPVELADGLEGRTLADRYRIETVVSTGAYTIITVALDQTNHQPITLKIVRPELVGRPGFDDDFVRHCKSGAALTHPNIASILDWGPVELAPGADDPQATWFWTGEYLAGGSLRDLLDRGRTLEPSQALVVGLEACRALDLAHQRGIVHTEITPSKLVFGDDRRLRVVDFGIAELLGADAWENPANVPTHVARYASPEQALGMEIDAKTDVYALSLSLIEAVTGSVPFAGDSTNSTLALPRRQADAGLRRPRLAGRRARTRRSSRQRGPFDRRPVRAWPRPGRRDPAPTGADPADRHRSVHDACRPVSPATRRAATSAPPIVPAEPAAPAGPTPVVALDPDVPVEPLIVMTDIADDPANAPAIVQPEPTREMVIGATEQMPATSPPLIGAAPPSATTAIPVTTTAPQPRSPARSSSTTNSRRAAS